MRTLPLGYAESQSFTARRVFPVGGLLFLKFMVDMGGHQPRQQVVEGLVVVNADGSLVRFFVLVDVDLLEEGLVEQTSRFLVCLKVGGVAVPGEVERVGQPSPAIFVVRFCSGELVLDAFKLAADAVLFGLEQVERDGSGVVRVEQLLSLCNQGDALVVEIFALGFGGAGLWI